MRCAYVAVFFSLDHAVDMRKSGLVADLGYHAYKFALSFSEFATDAF